MHTGFRRRCALAESGSAAIMAAGNQTPTIRGWQRTATTLTCHHRRSVWPARKLVARVYGLTHKKLSKTRDKILFYKTVFARGSRSRPGGALGLLRSKPDAINLDGCAACAAENPDMAGPAKSLDIASGDGRLSSESAVSSPAQSAAPSECRMHRILIVDDSAVDRRLAGRLLEKHPDFAISYAGDGAEALESFAKEVPDVVVTDLQMPVMNGLKLVESVRDKHPLVPVILMTAHGSEEVAVQALLSGAASYVPKVELAKHLLDTVQSVLAAARSNRQHQRLMECARERELDFVLDNDSSLIAPLVDQVQRTIAEVGLVDDTSRVQVAIALEEALLNSLYHGNLELSSEELEEMRSTLVSSRHSDPIGERRAQAPYCDRRIHVSARISRDEARFVIRDEGKGFDPDGVPDPADPENLTKASGRGLVLMRMFMDEISRNGSGNEVCLVKRRDRQASAV